MDWTHRRGALRLRTPVIMGILNVTPDSFSDGGLFLEPDVASVQADRLIADGAGIIDVGGESTRPGAIPVSAPVQIARVVPVIRALRERSDVPISVDTTSAQVALAALEAGADIINDISGATFDPDMLDVVRQWGAGLVLSHTPARPEVMMQHVMSGDVVRQVMHFLRERLLACHQHGIHPAQLVVDPGLGFGKSPADNVLLMRNSETLERATGRPVLVGISRKRTVRHFCGDTPQAIAEGTTAFETLALASGARIVRTHDVNAAVCARNAVAAWSATM